MWNGAGQADGYGDSTCPDGAERFRDAYRHLVTLFREEGATNVTWFFHADAYRQGDWWNELSHYDDARAKAGRPPTRCARSTRSGEAAGATAVGRRRR